MISLPRRVEYLLHLGSRDLFPPIKRIHAVDLLFDIGAVGGVYQQNPLLGEKRGNEEIIEREREGGRESGNEKMKPSKRLNEIKEKGRRAKRTKGA